MLINNYTHGRPVKLIVILLALFSFCLGSRVSGQTAALTRPGTFEVGCNYWASHAGVKMWENWDAAVVEKDLQALSAGGIKIIRVFPLWPDFQPIVNVYGASGVTKFVAFKNGNLPADGPGAAGMSEEALNKFQEFIQLAEKNHIKVIVGLITGWMSGQLFVPPALAGKSILTDAESLSWQQKFVKTFVHRFKNEPAIVAWDFGNECNVMEEVKSHYEAYNWAALLGATIKMEDPSRPLLSGMHSLSADPAANWRIVDQGQVTDVLTTHPYSLWTPYASHDPVTSIRTLLHAAAEGNLYADIGGKPCLTEETGIMGPMTAGEDAKAHFARAALFSSWANNCHGLLWWCGFDQRHLNFTPYTYQAVEQELGLMKADRTPKPVMKELTSFSSMLDHLPFKALPERQKEAVCLLTQGQDNWAVAYHSYVLAKEAGFDFKFQMAGQRLATAPLYLMPSVKGLEGIQKPYWQELLQKVREGATLYISLDDAYLADLTEALGIDIESNTLRNGPVRFKSIDTALHLNLTLPAIRKLKINAGKSNVLATDEDGSPVLLQSSFGKGQIYLLTFPIESDLAQIGGAFNLEHPPYYELYKYISKPFLENRAVEKPVHPHVIITEHPFSANEKAVIIINYGSDQVRFPIKLKTGWYLQKTLYGNVSGGLISEMRGDDAAVFIIKRK